MARIKSALELALERTESVKSDKESVELYELRREGKKLAGAFLDDPEKKSLEGDLKKYPKDKAAAVRRGIFDVLLSQIALPAVKEDLPRLEKVGAGLQSVLADRRFAALYAQLIQAFTQYLGELEQYEQAIRRQYAPKLRQKEEELSRRMGRAVQLDPFQDPEFVAFFNQNMAALKGRYQSAVDQVRSQAEALMGE